MSNLFESAGLEGKSSKPLADKLRPKALSDIYGQDHLVGSNAPLSKMIEKGNISSLILWGPPGCGKTTLARILADSSGQHYEHISAIFSGVSELRKVFGAARERWKFGQGSILFVDEIHRFNKSQQDAFLPVVEEGIVTLIGATTENPSFELNSALLSRCQVYVLKRLDDEALDCLIARSEKQMGRRLPISDKARDCLKALADGDGRYLLNLVEQIFNQARGDIILGETELMALVQKRLPVYDKGDEGHYNLISALHKSVRGSDPDAALYWLCRMFEGGEDPGFLGRRLVRIAIEDICLADPQALNHALNAWQAYERLGSPEGELALANAVLYLASAPKSNAVYTAYNKARKSARESGSLMPPKEILNAPTSLMKDQGYSKGYIYDHDTPEGFSGQNYFPDEFERQKYYKPEERGFEREIKKRLSYWEKLRSQKKE